MKNEKIEQLLSANLFLKNTDNKNSDIWEIKGVASSEKIDNDGEIILRNQLDISYVKSHGYINWNHEQTPDSQIGFIKNAEIIGRDDISKYEDIIGKSISSMSSLYVEGILYKHVPKAFDVFNILKSTPQSFNRGLGLSIEGVRKNQAGLDKAIIRGVAVTHIPCQTDSLFMLSKSLSSPQVKEINTISENKALKLVLDYFPNISLKLAYKIIDYTRSSTNA